MVAPCIFTGSETHLSSLSGCIQRLSCWQCLLKQEPLLHIDFFCFVLFFLVTREGPHPPRTCLIFVLGKDEKLNWEVTGLKLKSRGHTQNCMLFFWFSKIKKFRPALELKRYMMPTCPSYGY